MNDTLGNAVALEMHGQLDDGAVIRIAEMIAVAGGVSSRGVQVWLTDAECPVQRLLPLLTHSTLPAARSSKCGLKVVGSGRIEGGAAILMVVSAFASAAKDTVLTFHAATTQAGVVGAEEARLIQVELHALDRASTILMARHVVRRLCERYAQLRELSWKTKKCPEEEWLWNMDAFWLALTKKLSADGVKWLRSASVGMGWVEELQQELVDYDTFDDSVPLAIRQAAVFNRLLAFSLDNLPQFAEDVSSESIGSILEDYERVIDVLLGVDAVELPERFRECMRTLLSTPDLEQFAEVEKYDSTVAQPWAWARVGGDFQVLWRCAVAHCASILRGSAAVAGDDAYWLGLIDAVLAE
jgi:hypothetical protein